MYKVGIIRKESALLGQTTELSISERYRQVRQACREKFADEFCNAVLPVTPIWLLPPKSELPTSPFGLAWYVWAGIGLVLGKVL